MTSEDTWWMDRISTPTEAAQAVAEASTALTTNQEKQKKFLVEHNQQRMDVNNQLRFYHIKSV
jgi:hypothetical protein